MRRLKDPNAGIPGGFYYDDPDTKMRVHAPCFLFLKMDVKNHRLANRLAIPEDLDEQIEDQLCSRIPDSFIADLPGQSKASADLYLTASQKIEMLQRDWKRLGALVVDPAEALSRAQICKACPKNIAVDCISCNGVYDWLCDKFSIPALDIDPWLHSCMVDRVYNKAQVHLDGRVFVKRVTREGLKKYPETCWKRQLIEKARTP